MLTALLLALPLTDYICVNEEGCEAWIGDSESTIKKVRFNVDDEISTVGGWIVGYKGSDKGWEEMDYSTWDPTAQPPPGVMYNAGDYSAKPPGAGVEPTGLPILPCETRTNAAGVTVSNKCNSGAILYIDPWEGPGPTTIQSGQWADFEVYDLSAEDEVIMTVDSDAVISGSGGYITATAQHCHLSITCFMGSESIWVTTPDAVIEVPPGSTSTIWT